MSQLSKREFLKIARAYIGSLFVNPGRIQINWNPNKWPTIYLGVFPQQIVDSIRRIPRTKIDKNGYLNLIGVDGELTGQVPLARTQWNLEKAASINRFDIFQPWGIVLHWFGDRERHNLTLEGYLEGFNGIQSIDDMETRTSAHFLVGDEPVLASIQKRNNSVSIIQTQAPDDDGIPFVSSHVLEAPFKDIARKDHYFVKAYEELVYREPGIDPMLLQLFRDPKYDPNFVTVSIEITGFDFDNAENPVSELKIANVVSLVWAIMQRYKISAVNIMGHNEFNMEKADPGKNFLALIRLLVGVMALVEDDEEMKELVFGQFLTDGRNYYQAISSYFNYIREYLLLVSSPDKIFEWEAASLYWMLKDIIEGKEKLGGLLVDGYNLPAIGLINDQEGEYIRPNNHDGVDFLALDPNNNLTPLTIMDVKLTANGQCIYKGETKDGHWGQTAMFLHRQPDGRELISIYAHVSRFEDFVVGENYKGNFKIGVIDNAGEITTGYLHFALAYRATWDTDLSKRPFVPANAGPTWIKQRFLNPLEFIADYKKRDKFKNLRLHGIDRI